MDNWACVNNVCLKFSKSNFKLMNNRSNINFSVSVNHQPVSKQRNLKCLGIMPYDNLS